VGGTHSTNPLNADTVLQGSLTVQKGSLSVDKLVIKKAPAVDEQLSPWQHWLFF
jgi:hypothetical protein